VPVAQVFAR